MINGKISSFVTVQGSAHININVGMHYVVTLDLRKNSDMPDGAISVWQGNTNVTKEMFHFTDDTQTAIPANTHNLWAVLDIVRTNALKLEATK